MLSRPAALALVAVACMTAAGIGSYVAVRQSRSGAPVGSTLTEVDRPVAPPVAPVALAEAGVVAEPAAAAAPVPIQAPEPEPKARPVAPAAVTRPAEARPVAVSAPEPPTEEPALPVERPAEPSPPLLPVAAVPLTGIGRLVELEPYEPLPIFDELIISADSVLGLSIRSTVSTDTAQLEDPVEARVTRAVTVAGRVAVPAGTRVLGSVTDIEPGGKIKERARLGVRFHTLVLPDTTRVPIQTEAIYREGDRPSNQSARKIGGAAVGGAILGAILGGSRGAAIGGAAGAGAGTAAAMAGDRLPATLAAGTAVTIRLTSPVTILVER